MKELEAEVERLEEQAAAYEDKLAAQQQVQEREAQAWGPEGRVKELEAEVERLEYIYVCVRVCVHVCVCTCVCVCVCVCVYLYIYIGAAKGLLACMLACDKHARTVSLGVCARGCLCCWAIDSSVLLLPCWHVSSSSHNWVLLSRAGSCGRGTNW